jgi:hypothetical protein
MENTPQGKGWGDATSFVALVFVGINTAAKRVVAIWERKTQDEAKPTL